MSLGQAATRLPARFAGLPWRLWGRQIGVLVQQEVRRSLFSRRRLWIYLLAFFPVLVIAVNHRLVHTSHPADAAALQDETRVFAGVVQFYYIRLALFFACLGIFTWLFRGEMVERTLHYPFLAAVRREVLVVGKFLAGAIVAIVLFELALAGCFYFLYSRFGSLGWAYVFHGAGLAQFGTYLLLFALAVLGYGSVFLALSLLFRNPIVPGALFLGWETISPVLPGWLQIFSVTFYLKQLAPVSLPAPGLLALFTVVTKPLTPALAVGGLLAFTAAVLGFSCWRIRRVEITYTTD
jgi:ABC-type transport system involved in multi-copper enzyme maturation permease subunit